MFVEKVTEKYTFKEPVSAEYIYVDIYNKVHLLMPIISGDSIGLDNTCKSTYEIQAFLGLFQDSKAQKSLEAYRDALNEDLQALQKHGKYSSKVYMDKQDRLNQVNNYLLLLQRVAPNYGDSYRFNKALQNLIAKKENLFAVHISCAMPDVYVKATNPVFSGMTVGVKRNALGEFENYVQVDNLGAALRGRFATTVIKLPVDSVGPEKYTDFKDALLAAVKARLPNFNANTDFTQLKKYIIEEAQSKSVSLSLVPSDPKQAILTKEYLETLCLVGDDDNTNIDTYFEAILNATGYGGEEWIPGMVDTAAALPQSFFKKIKLDENGRPVKEKSLDKDDKEKIDYDGADRLSILTQFFLAQINIHCRANNISGQDFGSILNGNFAYGETDLRQILADTVSNALASGQNVERAIFDFVNLHYHNFGMYHQLDEHAFNAILEKFNRHFTMIEDSEHFDEFIELESDKSGSGVCHNNRISVSFAEFCDEFYKLGAGYHHVPYGAIAFKQSFGWDDPLYHFMTQRNDDFDTLKRRLTSQHLSHKNDIVAQSNIDAAEACSEDVSATITTSRGFTPAYSGYTSVDRGFASRTYMPPAPVYGGGHGGGYDADDKPSVVIISKQAIRVGCIVGLAVTAVVGTTLCMYFVAPAMMPVVLFSAAKALATAIGVGMTSMPAMVTKGLLLTAGAGILAGGAATGVVVAKDAIERAVANP